ncbi:hypothetical protein G5I_12073 [Acromyrmex echinatior]|uniref:Uncharacterized protein n=1 Tax=Acromyrmex echinatior TaxID=103372 RepID=F4X1B4_ACREC|nr:hypothetical protein G5I_12073 [Acromyrmex echinatior]
MQLVTHMQSLKRIITFCSGGRGSNTLSSTLESHQPQHPQIHERFNELNARYIIERQFFFRAIISATPEPCITIVQVSPGAITAPSPSHHDHRPTALQSRLVTFLFAPRDLSYSPKLDEKKPTLRGNSGSLPLVFSQLRPGRAPTSKPSRHWGLDAGAPQRSTLFPFVAATLRTIKRVAKSERRERGWLNVHPSDGRYG